MNAVLPNLQAGKYPMWPHFLAFLHAGNLIVLRQGFNWGATAACMMQYNIRFYNAIYSGVFSM